MSVKNNRNSAASAADNDFICVDKTIDCILFNNFNRLRRGNNTTVTTSGIFFHDMPISFSLILSFFFSKEFADRLGRIFECRIIWINANLSDNCYNRCADKAADTKLLS